MPQTTRHSLWRFATPRYWSTWLALAVVRMSLLLPYPAMLRLAELLGLILYHSASKRRRTTLINLQLCFPEMTLEERQKIARNHFTALAMLLFETALSWWGSDQRIRNLYRVEGLEHLEQARARGKGVLMLSGHYTTLEISSRFLTYHVDDIQPVYKPAKNKLVEAIMTRARLHQFDEVLPNKNMHLIVRRLRQGKIIWYAPDQDFGRAHSILAPFFGTTAATLPTTARLARITGAPVVPLYIRRLPDRHGFLVQLSPPLENFPSGDDLTDATRTNKILETQIMCAPEQYLWIHKRFKTRPPGEPYVY